MKTKLLVLLSITVALFLSAAPARAVLFGDGGVALQDVLDDITKNSSGNDPLDPASPDGNPATNGTYDSSVNVISDVIPDLQDSYWGITATGGSIETIIVELAAWAGTNTLGIFDMADPTNQLLVFSGPALAGSSATITISDTGAVVISDPIAVVLISSGTFAGNAFGFYMNSLNQPAPDDAGGNPQTWYGGTMYSDTSLNTDGQDHMAAYQGKGDTVKLPGKNYATWTPSEYVLAFEDLDSQHWDDGDGVGEGYPEWSGSEPDFTDFVVMIESVEIVPVPAAVLLGILGLGIAGIKLRKFA